MRRAHPDRVETRLAEPHPTDAAARALVTGVVLLLVGLTAIAFSTVAALMTVLMLGIALLAGGLTLAVTSSRRWTTGPALAQFLSALLLVGVGIFLIVRPFSSVRLVTSLLLALVIIDGLYLVVTSLQLRPAAWGVRLGAGALMIVLALVLGLAARKKGLWLPGTLVGLLLSSHGVELIAGSFRERARLRRRGLRNT